MEQRPPTKKEIVDLIIAEATYGRFKGDKRDGETPPITIQNFTAEMARYAAKALRARLSRLSFLELATEALAALDSVEARQEQLSQIVEDAERIEREEGRRRQAERGRKRGLQPDILAAARHYRDKLMNAGEAWDAIKENPFKTNDGVVEITGSKLWA
jgi:hypothetical protein